MLDSPCGTCTQCCHTMAVLELNKPRHTWCRHCIPGVACTIYEARPQSCRDFQCLWLQTQAIPETALREELRPDRCKVVMDVSSPTSPEHGEQRLVLHTTASRPEAYRTGQVKVLVDALLLHGQKVWVRTPNELRLISLRGGTRIERPSADSFPQGGSDTREGAKAPQNGDSAPPSPVPAVLPNPQRGEKA